MVHEKNEQFKLMTVAQCKRILPDPIYSVGRDLFHRSVNLKYNRFLKKKRIRKERLLIFGTITRSGLNFGKFMIANYLKLLAGTSTGPLGPSEMVAMFPNLQWYHRYVSPRTFTPPTPELDLLGIDDVTHIHSGYRKPYFDGSKVIHFYRNPLDYAVSRFFFYYKNNTDTGLTVSNPVEALELELDEYVDFYRSYQQAARSGKASVLRISYESLILNPATCLEIILGWLGVEASQSLIETAVRYSNRETIKGLNDRWEHESQPNFVGRHINNGSIGQWKQYFSPSEVNHIQERLSGHGIRLEDFQLEA